ncbi:MAG: RDD family protein [Nocardiaceae bacterium]|nr:RDD family protein [Nocardiaceae bacterium]
MSNGASTADQSHEYAGKRLGLPEDGADSLAPVMRRFVGTVLDWLLAEGLVVLAFGQELQDPRTGFWVMGVWALMGTLSVWLFSFTTGQLLLGMRVVRVGAEERVGIGRALIRSALLSVVVPAFFVDIDGRGLHDRLSGTAVVRTR